MTVSDTAALAAIGAAALAEIAVRERHTHLG